MVSKKVIYKGRVQGVGFRYTCCQLARHAQVVGWVRNLPDGQVELAVRGQQSEVSSLLASIRTHERLSGYIRDEVEEPVLESEFDQMEDFSIRR